MWVGLCGMRHPSCGVDCENFGGIAKSLLSQSYDYNGIQYLPPKATAHRSMSLSHMASGELVERADAQSRSGAAQPRRLEIRSHLQEALSLLLQAHDYAHELEQDAWDLAVELNVLHAAKLSNSDLRWLIGMGYVEHAVEITCPTDRTRQFRRTSLVSFSEPTCVVLTHSGVIAAQEFCASEALPLNDAAATACRVVTADEPLPLPKWDDQRRQLRVGAEVVKEFKLPSPNQETVLMAFEEDGWPPRIDDPLPPLPQLDPRRRLHDTIKALNRKQKTTLLRFMGDGSGEGIRWEFLSERAAASPRSLAAE